MDEPTQHEITIQRNSDFLHTFTGDRGARTLTHLSDICYENYSTFDINSARKSDFNEGARSVILEIRHWLELDIAKLDNNETVTNSEKD